jgi:hypothetical protein
VEVFQAKDILALAIERASALNTYWNLFIAVSTGIVGVMASGKSFTASRPLKGFLSVAFALFAYSNLDAILKLGDLRLTLLVMLPADLPTRAALFESLRPAAPWQYIVFHLVFDLVVLATIWIVRWPSGDK